MLGLEHRFQSWDSSSDWLNLVLESISPSEIYVKFMENGIVSNAY